MGLTIEHDEQRIRVRLSGWDRLVNGRRSVEVDRNEVAVAQVARRADLERLVDHRALGCGTHDGAKRPGRRRIGTMLGRGVEGTQFWATGASEADVELLVLDLHAHEFSRLVLAVDDPQRVAAALTTP